MQDMKFTRRSRRAVITLATAILAVPAVRVARAQTVSTWQGSTQTGTANWSDSNNWTAGVPGATASDVATFNITSGTTQTNVNLDQNESLNALNFYGTNAGTWNIGSTNGSTLNLSGNCSININNATPVLTVNLNCNLIGAIKAGSVAGTGLVIEPLESHNTPQTLNLAGNNKFSGGEVDVETGNLELSNVNALNGISTLFLNINATNTANGVTNALTFNTSGIILNCTVDLARKTIIEMNSYQGTISGPVTGTSTSSFQVSAGTDVAPYGSALTLSNPNNTNTNGYTITSDTRLIAAANNALGQSATATITVSSGGSLGFQSSTGINYSTAEAVSINNNGANDGAGAIGAIESITGYNSFPGAIAFSASSSKTNGIGVKTGRFTLTGNITSSSGSGELEKIGPGTLVLTGNNTYNGATQIDAGTLMIGSTTALSGTSQVNVSSGSRLDFYTGTGGQFNVGSSGKLYLQAGGAIGGEIGGTLNFGTATTFSGTAVAVDIYAPGPTSTSNTPNGSYTLVNASGGGLNTTGATYSVGNVVNDTNFNVSSLTITNTSIAANVTGVTALATAYWTGSYAGGVWDLSNGYNSSNWAANNDGTGVTGLIPAATTNVVFSAVGAVNQSNVVLGSSQTINSLTFNDSTAMTLNYDGTTLTIAGPGININGGAGVVTLNDNIALTGATPAITVNSISGLTINGALNSSSTMTTNGTGTAIYNGPVYAPNGLTTSGSATAIYNGSSTIAGTLTTTALANTVFNGAVNLSSGLTVAGAGTTSFNGVISGSGGFTASGPANVFLNAANTYTGNTSVTGGSLVLNQSGGTQTLLAAPGGGGFTGNLVVSNAIRVNFDNGIFSGGGQIQIQSTGTALTNSNTAFGPGTVSNPIVLNSTALTFTKGNVTTSPYTPGTFVTTIGGTASSNTTSPIIFSGVISGNSDVNIANNATTGGGSGAISLGSSTTPGGPGGYDTYSGTTTINSNNATINFLNTNVLPTSTDVITGTFNTSGSNGLGATVLNLNGYNQAIGSISDGAYATASAHTVTVTNNGSSPAILTIGGSVSPANSFSGPIKDGTNTIGLVKIGTDTIGISSSSSQYSGGVVVNQGTLVATGGSNSLPTLGKTFVTVNPTGTSGTTADAATIITNGSSVANATVLTVNTNSPTAIGTVKFVAGGPTIGSLSGNGSVVLGNTSGTTLTIGYTNNLTSIFSGVISDASAGLGTIIKGGNGTLTLSGSNTYTGTTNVSTGSLNIAATGVLASSTVTVNPTAGFNVSSGGTISASTVLTAYGTVSFGSAETLASLTVASTGTLNLGAGVELTDTGAANFAGTLNLTSPVVNQVLMTYPSASQAGTFTSTNLPGGERLSYAGGKLEVVSAGPSSLFWNGAGTAWDTGSPDFTGPSGAVAFSDSSNVSTGDIVVFNDANNSGGQYNVVITASGVHPTSVTFASSNSAPGYNISGGAIGGAGSLTVTGSGTVILSNTNNYSGGTFVNNGKLVLASANAFPSNTNLNTSSGAQVILANHGSNPTYVVVTSALSNNGTIDLNNNAMVLHNASIGAITAEISQAYGNGAWNGTNSASGVITSSMAANDTTGLTAVGVATGLTSFQGTTVLADDVLVKYTYYGDADLDGHVDGSDYSRIDNGVAMGLTGWANGDFNYDGVINGSDYTLIDNVFNTQGASLAGEVVSPAAIATAQIVGGAGTSAVPEPGSVALMTVASLAMLRRRKRQA